MKNKVYFLNKVNNFIISCLPYILPIVIVVFALFKFSLIKEKATEMFKYNFTDLEVGVILIISSVDIKNQHLNESFQCRCWF